MLVLTGHCRGRCHLVRVRAKDVWVPRQQFRGLCTLIFHRIDRSSQPAEIPPLIVHRLRKVLDESGNGELTVGAVIDTEAVGRYRLGISPARVAIDESFGDLSTSNALEPRVFLTLRSRFKQRK